jgi:hypothetical protein
MRQWSWEELDYLLGYDETGSWRRLESVLPTMPEVWSKRVPIAKLDEMANARPTYL